MDSKRIVSVGIESNIFVNQMVLGHHKINPQLFDFQSLSLIGIQLFATDILRFTLWTSRWSIEPWSNAWLTGESNIFLLTKVRIEFIWLAYGPVIARIPFINLFKDISPRKFPIRWKFFQSSHLKMRTKSAKIQPAQFIFRSKFSCDRYQCPKNIFPVAMMDQRHVQKLK